VSGFLKEEHPCSKWFYNNVGVYIATYILSLSVVISNNILREILRWMTGKQKYHSKSDEKAKVVQNTAIMYYINIALMPIFITLVTRSLTYEGEVITDSSTIDFFNSRWYYKHGTVIMTTIFLEVVQSGVLTVLNVNFVCQAIGRCNDQSCKCSKKRTKHLI